MTTPPQDTPPDLPDRVYEIVGTDSSGNPMYRPTHPFMALDGTERFETFRTWFVGEDGKTSIERERDALRAVIYGAHNPVCKCKWCVEHEQSQQEPDDE